ncbi:hypothetical protein J6I90_06650 [Pseudidiomarina sp. 1APP75-32.1]|uniref:Uncharacterized protein n=1 Tax=Pseudidiomarina terrestris TaxID=2820060 RepID=A0AAW7QWJ3_9GAMM|nr:MULTISPECIES: hypothetical protein [unclassified Pseudidiomarina]MDN7124556.1 hypothetical protein [Pseudidiomarina sp. 1APP75-32.1]MDN7129153.1 hypothetical protein [Pseudidiomarina sp. 1APR75-15]MDN7136747.1 hypothetical protein [Pseudidiomarina sp. 1ASP75-14]
MNSLITLAFLALSTGESPVQEPTVTEEQQSDYVTSSFERAQDVGVSKCLETVKSLSGVLVDEHAHGSHDMWSTDAPDERVFDSVIVKGYSDTDSHISMTVVPRDGACDWRYTETYVVEKACTVIRDDWFGEFGYLGALNETSLALSSEENVNIYLTPVVQGKMCLVSKRETYIAEN